MESTIRIVSKLAGIAVALGGLASQAMAGGVSQGDTITADGQCELSPVYAKGYLVGVNYCLPGTGNPPKGNVSYTTFDPGHDSGIFTSTTSTTAYATVWCGIPAVPYRNNVSFALASGQFYPNTSQAATCMNEGDQITAVVCGSNPVCQNHQPQ